MAGPRFSSIWPALISTNVEMVCPTIRSARAAARIRAFHRNSHYRQPDAVQQRYGTANEPPPHLGGGKGLGPLTAKQTIAEAPKALPKIGEQLQRDGEAEVKAKQARIAKDGQEKLEPTTIGGTTPGPILSDPALNAGESEATENPPASLKRPADRPMEFILNTVASGSEDHKKPMKPAPEDKAGISFDEHAPPIKIPHMDTPRHVHHFDTYGLVRNLVDSGWSDMQAITIMKSLRLVMAENMDIAREALISKSQVENETYLFRAACAELKTEVTGRRKAEQEKMRTERTQLQHELDILSQRLGQDSGVLKDDLKGMFDDRKMAVRNEQRSMESKIQRLNYQITVELQADGKSEVEGLRWVMTRRVIIALGAVVIMVLGSLKIYSNTVREQEMDTKRRSTKKSSSAPQDVRVEGADGDMLVKELLKEGDNPSFVSLG